MSSSTADRVIRQILRGGNHFDVLKLAKPYPDLLGEPIWEAGEEQVNRAFRKQSLYCHPDKSKHPDAPRAFEVLKKAKACLLHELDRDAYVRNYVREQKTRWEGNWTSAQDSTGSRERASHMRADAQVRARGRRGARVRGWRAECVRVVLRSNRSRTRCWTRRCSGASMRR